MPILTKAGYDLMRNAFDSAYGQEATLKLHSKYPNDSMRGTEHLVAGDGIPVHHTYSDAVPAVFTLPHVKPTWWRRLLRKPFYFRVAAVSLWRDGRCLDITRLGREVQISSGGTLHVTVPKPRML